MLLAKTQLVRKLRVTSDENYDLWKYSLWGTLSEFFISWKSFLHFKDLHNDHFWQGDTLFCFTTLSRLVFFNLHLLSFNKCSLKSIKEINALIRKEMSNIYLSSFYWEKQPFSKLWFSTFEKFIFISTFGELQLAQIVF